MTTIKGDPMKIAHQLSENMLVARGITKKSLSNYEKIPYYTVAG